MSEKLLSHIIRTEEDVVSTRRRAREIAAELGFDNNEQTRIATAVSEIARNAFRYANGGTAEFHVDLDAGMYTIRVADRGTGIKDLNSVMNGTYESQTGMGLGIVGAQRLMDAFSVDSTEAGTVVTLSKRLPRTTRTTPDRLAKISAAVAHGTPRDLLDELRQENQDLLRVMEELKNRQDDLARLNSELEDTNRGVVALYAELDEKAEGLRRADQMKSRFLSHMSHEFRTPLTSIMALSRLLMDEADGKLNSEQLKQVTYIRKSAESLLEMVNDLLDLARVEAGRSVVRAGAFQIGNLFSAMRGVLRPLQTKESVELIFDDPGPLPPMFTDEAKVAQILRNFVSNALKFTERGEVRVSARLSADGETAIFAVRDTGIGIERESLEMIFQEFAQIDSPIQAKYRGTGLGLPLSKGLAELLGGRVRVESQAGRGSTFYAEIPMTYSGPDAKQPPEMKRQPGCDVLVIDDEEVSRYLARQTLGPSLVSAEAPDGRTGIQYARERHPRAILLDIRMPGMTGFEVLKQLKADDSTRDIPVIVMTSKSLTADERAILSSQVSAVFSKEVLSQPDGGERIRRAIKAGERT